jgi:Cys-rich protein (TIGR01571 family)
MALNGNGNLKADTQAVESRTSESEPEATGVNSISTQDVSRQGNERSGFLNFVNRFTGPNLRKLGHNPSVKFRQLTLARDEFSRSIHSDNHGNHEHFHLIRKINWGHLWVMGKEWIRQPMNMALFAWIACVAVSGAILFMVMTGMLNHALPSKPLRDTWFEVNNKILNALFTLMCLYQHPMRIYNFVLLCRWDQKDILRLRKVYCKNGTYKPNEWMHMMVVVVLLNLNCFGQYALCGLNIGYRRSERPPIGVAVSISVAIGAAAFASVYNIVSPLGKDYDPDEELREADPEAQSVVTSTEGTKPATSGSSLERRYSFLQREERRFVESRPEWVGGLADFWDGITLAYLSIFCSCCVFGWNVQRLGFGNMYVHIATFLLFCAAPFFIFNMAAININNETLREALGLTGIALCFFGLLYGGFWRIQMRKRFNLPGNTFCCRNPDVTDCFQWLCCCSCSLAQEVRTADYYDIAEERSYRGQATEESQRVMSPLRREDGLPLFKSTPASPYRSSTPSRSIFIMESPSAPRRSSGATPLGGSPTTGDRAMQAPSPSVLHREGGDGS